MPLRTFRCAAAFLWLILGLAGAAHAQSQVYLLDGGRFACPGPSATCHGPRIYLVNSATGHTLARFDVTAGPRGTSLRLSSDGSRLYITADPGTGTNGELLVVDAITKGLVGRVTVGQQPSDVAVLPDNSRAYVVNRASNSVSVIDLTSLSVVATVAVQSAPVGAAVSPDGNAIYVTNGGSDSVSKIAAATNTVAATISVGQSPWKLDISPDGSRIFVANSQTVSVIDAQNDSLLRNLTVQSISSGGVPTTIVDVVAQSATRIYVGLSGGASRTAATHYLDAANGAVLADLGGSGLLTRDSSGSPVFLVRNSALTRFVDGVTTSAVAIERASVITGAAVLTDPCAFEASASPPAFALAGGSGTLSIPAPAGCSWTVDRNGVAGLTLSGSTSGSGPATRTFTLAPGSAPDYGTIEIGRQSVSVERTVPLMTLDAPAAGPVAASFSLVGWAMDQNAAPQENAGIDGFHVWATPASGVPFFVTAAACCTGRLDVARVYGDRYHFSGFDIPISTLAPGTYTLTVFAHSARSNTFASARSVVVTVAAPPPPPPPLMSLDAPAAGATVSGTFPIIGWALDPSGPATGTGIDVIHAWAAPAGGGPAIFAGQGSTAARPDVAAVYGNRYFSSGFVISATLAPGAYTLTVYARSVTSQQFVIARSVAITVAAPVSVPRMSVDTPASGATISAAFSVQGWALDLGAPSGTGVDAVHVWATSVPAPGGGGATTQFLAAGSVANRPDVGSAFGSRYNTAGFATPLVTLAPGPYQLTVYARSTVTGTFNNATTITVVVQ